MKWLVAAAAGCVSAALVTLATYVPLRDTAGVEYLFIPPPLSAFVLASSGAIVLLAVAYLFLVSFARRVAPDRVADIRGGRWLSPLANLIFLPAGFAAAIPGVGKYAAPIAFVAYDLRWWWIAVLAVWTALEADAALGGRAAVSRVARWPLASRLFALDTLIFTFVIGWATVTTPLLRFSGVLVGDEPKYVRYCEVWYQGGGLAVSYKALITDEPLDAAPRVLHTIPLLLRTVREEGVALVRDVREFASRPREFTWNRAYGANGFLTGKHGGVYQIHQPGVSAVLFPGYFLDRYLLGLTPGYNAEFPEELILTVTMMLLVYGACAVALFRLLRRTGVGDGTAAIWAAIGALTFPISAFPFQLYPELPAALIVLLVSTFALFPEGRSTTVAAAAGAACGALVWLHPRFLLVAGCLSLAVALHAARHTRRVFIGFAMLVLMSFLFANYRITGSWMPTAVWDAGMPERNLTMRSAVINMTGYAFDRSWGLLPHAPLLLAVVAGIAVMLRRSPRHGLFIVATTLALLLPSAAYTLSAAGTTPGRLVVGVIPLLIWPVALIGARLWRWPAARAAIVLVVTLSVQCATVYNWSHDKGVPTIADTSASGWKLNLAFPGIRDRLWGSTGNTILFLSVIAALAALSWFLARRCSTEAPPSDSRVAGTRWWHGAATAGVFILLASAATAANGSWNDDNYMLDAEAAVRIAAERLVPMANCRQCVSSRRTSINWKSIGPNGADGLTLGVTKNRLAISLELQLMANGGLPAFGKVRVDFGDQTPGALVGVVDRGWIEHTYSAPGRYKIVGILQLPDGRLKMTQFFVDVGA